MKCVSVACLFVRRLSVNDCATVLILDALGLDDFHRTVLVIFALKLTLLVSIVSV